MPDQEPAPYTPDHPAVVMFSGMENMAEHLSTAARMFSEVAGTFAAQVALAKAMVAAAGRENRSDG